MSSSLRRVVPSKPASAATPSPAPERSAEPGEKITFAMFTLDKRGKLAPFGSIEVAASRLELYTEAIEAIADTDPRDIVQVGRPGTRLIVTRVDKSDPDFIGGEFALDLGEVVTVPELVEFLVVSQHPTSAPLVRYYLKQHKPFEKCGYTLQDIEDFQKELSGPNGKHLHAVAEANIAWAKENHREPLQ